MPHNKRKKSNRMRGLTTHGHGAKKKWRGAGHRGGRGNAGTGKRADSKKPSFWADKDYFGKHGFKMPQGIRKNKNIKSINIADIEERLDKFLSEKIITEKNGVYDVELAKLGYDKLLSTGKVKHKLKITASYSSSNAIVKIKDAGGEVVVLNASSTEAVDNSKEE